MSPFQKNLQKLLVYFFSAISIIIVIIGVLRTKSNTELASTAPGLAPAPTGASTSASKAPGGSSTFKGSAYQTPWGNAVAAISVINGKITEVTMPTVPPSPPSQYAEPYLVQQALAAGSANIQGVSGATYTSIAFKSSLESAITKAAAQGQAVTENKTSSSASASPVTTPAIPRRYQDDD